MNNGLLNRVAQHKQKIGLGKTGQVNGVSRYISSQISASTRRRRFLPSRGGGDFRSHTAAQIFALTQRRRFSLSHGGADFRQNFDQHTATQMQAQKFCEKKPGPQFFFFETVSVEQGFMTEKVCFMTENVCFMTEKVCFPYLTIKSSH